MPAVNPFPPGPWARTLFRFANNERQWMNEIWWNTSGTATSGFNIITFATAVDTALTVKMMGCTNEGVHSEGSTTYYNNGTYTTSGTVYTNETGPGSSGQLPSESAVVVRLQANIKGPSGRGRVYLSGVDESFVTESRLNTTGQTAMTTLTTAIQAGLSNQGIVLKPVVYSRKLAALNLTIYCQWENVLGHIKKRRPRF